MTFANSTDSTDKDSGAVIVQGGVGIEKNLHVGNLVKIHANVNSTDKDTGALVVEFGGLGVELDINAGGYIAAVGTMSAANLSGSNSGDVTLNSIGAAPNANGASLSGQALTLQPASAAFGGVVTTGSQSFAGDKTFTGSVVISQDLTVNGTMTSISSVDLEIEDANIIINKGGSDASAQGAGLTVERTGTHGSIVYDSAAASKFKLGALGSEVQIADISTSQTLTNKTIDAASNTISNIANANIAASAAIAVNKLAAQTGSKAVVSDASGFITTSATSDVEIGYVAGATSNIQTQLNALQVNGWRKYIVMHGSFQTAATTNSVTIDTLTDMVVTGVIIDHSLAAVGTGITDYKLSVGITGQATRFAPKHSVFTAPSGTDHAQTALSDIPEIGAAYAVKLFAESVGANLDQSTAGTFVIYLKVDKIP